MFFNVWKSRKNNCSKCKNYFQNIFFPTWKIILPSATLHRNNEIQSQSNSLGLRNVGIIYFNLFLCVCTFQLFIPIGTLIVVMYSICKTSSILKTKYHFIQVYKERIQKMNHQSVFPRFFKKECLRQIGPAGINVTSTISN